jgi:hypothetical protein
MKTIERFIVDIEREPWSMIYRGAIGFALPPIFRALTGGNDSVWITSVLFVAVLAALRVGPLVLRRLLPFSADAMQIWSARRLLSKEHDSYAWQKLFWIGLGLLLYAAIGGGLQIGEVAVTLFCLIGGGAGLLVWRGVRALRPMPQ